MSKVVGWGATERRYEVYCIEVETGEMIEEYSGGNSPWESQYTLAKDHPRALPLSKMREFAESTAREMAEEHGAEYAGEDEDTTQGIRELYEAIDEGRF